MCKGLLIDEDVIQVEKLPQNNDQSYTHTSASSLVQHSLLFHARISEVTTLLADSDLSLPDSFPVKWKRTWKLIKTGRVLWGKALMNYQDLSGWMLDLIKELGTSLFMPKSWIALLKNPCPAAISCWKILNSQGVPYFGN